MPAHSNVVIIGAGPVGLVASLLLSSYHIAHILVEQRDKPDPHPQAHFINCRSMEILRELNALDQAVYARSAPMDEWRRFVYCTGLADLPHFKEAQTTSAGSLLGVVDHFAADNEIEHSPEQVVHFPQHDFVRLLRAAALESRFCHALEGHRARIQEHRTRVAVTLINTRTDQQQQVETPYVVAADGARSATRKGLGIKLISHTDTLQHLINVHFFSPRLADHLRSRLSAMLYFVYSSAGVAVLVAHALRRGEFVAQIPYFPPYQQAEDFDADTCNELIQKLVGQSLDIDIRSIRRWRMGVGLAARFRSRWGRCFLIGDAAHQFTPAGGFGMNTGIQDAHNLIWKIALALRSENGVQFKTAERLLSSYEQERAPVAQANANLSVKNYRLTLKIPRAIGLDLKMIGWLSRFVRCWPGSHNSKRRLFRRAMRLGLKQIDWLKFNNPIARRRYRAVHKIFSDAKRQTLQLLFPGQDLGFRYPIGWMFAENQDPDNHLDPLTYQPELKIGGRMPHFWLTDHRGQRISVLDLPRQMMGADATPCYVLLKAGSREATFQDVEALADQPVVGVIVTRKHRRDEHFFSYEPDRPAFLPRSFAVLVRPDGHIAWLQMHASNDRVPSGDVKAANGRG